jgi:hypothetical protein
MNADMADLDRFLPEGWIAPEDEIHSNGLGVFGANLGSGQHRFWFVPKERTSQESLFAQGGGILLREIHPSLLVRALYLYPSGSMELPECEAFMLLLGTQPNAQYRDEGELDGPLRGEYERLAILAIDELADPTREHFPNA